MIGLTAVFPALTTALGAVSLKMLAFKGGMLGVALVAGVTFGRFLDNLIKDRFPALDKAIIKIIGSFFNLETNLKQAGTQTRKTFAEGLEKAATKLSTLDRLAINAAAKLGTLAGITRDAGIEFKNLSPSLQAALKGVTTGAEAAALFTAEANKLNAALKLQAELAGKAGDAVGGVAPDPGDPDAETDLIKIQVISLQTLENLRIQFGLAERGLGLGAYCIQGERRIGRRAVGATDDLAPAAHDFSQVIHLLLEVVDLPDRLEDPDSIVDLKIIDLFSLQVSAHIEYLLIVLLD